jgi:Trypsin-like peptidase domain
MDPKRIERLVAALLRGEHSDTQPLELGSAVQAIADSLGQRNSPITASETRAAARVLNACREFDHTRRIAEAWTALHGFDATVAKHHAQALINSSALDAAQSLLTDGLARLSGPGVGAQASSERLEYEGLLARIDKQRFVATADLDWLVKATDRYLAQFAREPGKPFWHGINAVALLARGEREGISRPGAVKAADLADAILRDVSGRHAADPSDPWLASTASEACLALNRCDEAELWLYRFLNHPKVTSFNVDSYDRQVREIWQGSIANEGASCANRLASALVRHIARTQGKISVFTSPASAPGLARALQSDRDGLERNFSGESSFSVEIVRRMLASCASIGCVTNRVGERLGTGFLVPGSGVKGAFGDSPVFVTNAHVVSDVVPRAIPRADARVTFEIESSTGGMPKFYEIEEVLFTSPPGEFGVCCGGYENLDATVVRLEGIGDASVGLETARQLPVIEPTTKAYVVGHPRGGGMQISLHDSTLMDIDDDERLVHYRTPTDPGSSGSPVFNAQWEVIALHHGGSKDTPRLHGQGHYEANEGITVNAIRRKLAS